MIFKNEQKIKDMQGRAAMILEAAARIKSKYDELELPELSDGDWGKILRQRNGMYNALQSHAHAAVKAQAGKYVKVDLPNTTPLGKPVGRLENYLAQPTYSDVSNWLVGCPKHGLKKPEGFDKRVEKYCTLEATEDEIKTHRLVKDLAKTIEELKKVSKFKWYNGGKDVMTDPLLNNMIVDGFNLEDYRMKTG